MAKNERRIKGVIPAVMTPLKEDGSMDMAALETHLRYLVDAGVDGLFIGGTTAEGAFLTAEERKRVFSLAKEVTGGKVTLYVVILRPHTEQVISELRDFVSLEPDYAATVTPFYYSVSQETIADHYTRIADASEVPFMLYNIPQNTHNPIALSTTLALAEHPNIVGIKDSSGAFTSFTQGLLTPLDHEFAWIQGEDILDAASLLFGAPGLVTGLGNVWIEPYVEMYRAACSRDVERVKESQRQINSLARIIQAAEGAVIPAIKMAAALRGRGNGRMRIPGDTIKPKIRTSIETVLRQLDLL
ncbi:MAG: dihydrodipicolinate synthase family protein [Alkalispirochaeta sp.]